MGTAIVRYNPVLGTEEVVKYSGSSIIKTKLHCITLMKEYENKSFEELRLEDRMAGRCKWSSIAGSWGKPQAKPLSGGFDQPAETKPLSGGFDQPAEANSPNGKSVFKTGTALVEYNPAVYVEVIGMRDGGSQSSNVKAHCITIMKEYENKSFEELRFEDRMAGRYWPSIAGSWGKPQAKPLSGGFDQPAEAKKPLSGGFDQLAEAKKPLSGGFDQLAEAKPLSGFLHQPAEAKPPNGEPGKFQGYRQLQNRIGTEPWQKYNPMHIPGFAMSNGSAQSTNIKSQCINIMKEAETKPLSGGSDQPAEAKPPNGKSESGPGEGLSGNGRCEATSKAASGGTGSNIPSWDVPECPVCLEALTAPILQCQGGHSLCSECSGALKPPKCPLCRKPMTSMRNWALEDIIEKAVARGAPARVVKRACANAGAGCASVFATARDAADHGKECIFRDMLCPLNEAFDNCFWIGKPKDMMSHFKQKHPTNCLVPGAMVRVHGIREGHNARNMWLVAQDSAHFIVSMKTDPDGVEWVVHHVGTKENAELYVYEIHVISKQEASRRAVFSERCTSDAEAASAPFAAGRCAALPTRHLPHFTKDGELTFRFNVRKDPPTAQPPDIANLALI